MVPFTGAPGSEDVARFVRDLLNAGGEKPDEFGWSASENMQGLDAGGAAAGARPPSPSLAFAHTHAGVRPACAS